MSSVDYLLIQEDAPAESTEGLKPSVHEEDTLDHGGDITAPSSSDVATVGITLETNASLVLGVRYVASY